MPITDLVFSGITRAVSDINTIDGGTAELINAVVENNEIRPTPIAFEPSEFDLSGRLLGVHSVSGQDVFIYEEEGDDGWYINFAWFSVAQGDFDTMNSIALPVGVKGPGRVDILGNVVAYGCPQGTYYFIYKDGGYVLLGDRPPFPKLAFGIDIATTYTSEESSLTATQDSYGGIPMESHRLFNSTAQAKISKFLSECRKEGKFVFPFFVRYAYRMFDGSHICHSAPILMNPSTEKIPFSVQMAPLVFESGSDTVTTKMALAGYKSSLMYRGINKTSDMSSLANWTDLITHIDVFISPPIYSYKELTPDFNSNSSGKVTYGACTRDLPGSYGVAALRTAGLSAAGDFIPRSDEYTKEWILPEYTPEEQREVVENTSLFYLVHSLSVADFLRAPDFEWGELPLKEGVLEALESSTILEDDYNSMVSKYSDTSEVYNQRLILGGMKLRAYEGYPLSTMRPMVHADTLITQGAKTMTTLQKGGTHIVVGTAEEDLSGFPFVGISRRAYGYHYYPDPHAQEMYVSTRNYAGVAQAYRMQLKPHSALNGAFCFMGYPTLGASQDGIGDTDWPAVTDSSYESTSEIYQSEVGNPFYFPLAGVTSIGNTPLIAIVASSIEMSTGQVGDFPMYAFTGDGVWAVSITPEGWLGESQLISNDVCLGRSSIVSLNRPIIFATQRGLMLLEGSKITCLSNALLGPRADLSQIKDAIKPYEEFREVLVKAESKESFIDFLAGEFDGSGGSLAYMVYDYANHRVLIMHPDSLYAYVLTLSNFEFSKITLPYRISHSISHYTGVYAQDESKVVRKLRRSIDTDGEETRTPVIVITRPIKFGEMNLKSIKRMLARHTCSSGVSAVLYGSRDGTNYCSITSLRGRSYRYYVLALFASMTPNERITGVAMSWERKFTNKLR